MASPALIASQFPSALKVAEQLHSELAFRAQNGVGPVLKLGAPALDELLPRRGLDWGSVVELQVRGASGAATSFALAACRAAQRVGEGSYWGEPWCAFIDPSATLFAPGVAELGVDLSRLLIVRPDADSVERVAVRIAEAKVVSVLVIDLRGALGELDCDHRRWRRTIRRLAIAIKQLTTCALVITQAPLHQSEYSDVTDPLPVAMRLTFSRISQEAFQLRVDKERTGLIGNARPVPWSVFGEGSDVHAAGTALLRVASPPKNLGIQGLRS